MKKLTLLFALTAITCSIFSCEKEKPIQDFISYVAATSPVDHKTHADSTAFDPMTQMNHHTSITDRAAFNAAVRAAHVAAHIRFTNQEDNIQVIPHRDDSLAAPISGMEEAETRLGMGIVSTATATDSVELRLEAAERNVVANAKLTSAAYDSAVRVLAIYKDAARMAEPAVCALVDDIAKMEEID